MQTHNHLEIGIDLTPDFYLDYIMTETNVAAAVRGGVRYAEIRSWVRRKLSASVGRQGAGSSLDTSPCMSAMSLSHR
jgi:hypothetical protein